MAKTTKTSKMHVADKLFAMRHSAAHILAMAVVDLYKDVKLGIGPVIENGFYYDFLLDKSISESDLQKIEKRMKEIISLGLKFKKKTVLKAEARKLFSSQPFKLEIIEELPKKKVTIYATGDQFVDLCAGPHVASTKSIGAFKLTRVAGAYWRGLEKNPQLQRIYGVVFPTQRELDDYLKSLEEAEKRDHRKLGRELDLFSFSEEVGAGLVLWHGKGSALRKVVEDFWKEEHRLRGYEYQYTPHIGNLNLWKKSGHWEFYREAMYSPMKIDDVEYLIKPMNCPFHIQIYKTRTHSYRELPIRFCELGTVYRYERAGVLSGLTRVRGFTQDDAHIFCTPEQLGAEIEAVLDLALYMLKSFGFNKYIFELSLRDPSQQRKYLGTKEIWNKAEKALERVLKDRRIRYQKGIGEAKFYGPAIDIKLLDALGREWQGPTIQVDFNLPEKFDVNYVGEDGKKHKVVMVHRTVLGSMERFVGVLIEHYAGAFPLWLSPVQVVILPIADRHFSYSKKIAEDLMKQGVRVEVNLRQETLNAKIREAELQKIPYVLVVGDKEVASHSASIRSREKGNEGAVAIESFKKRLFAEIENKK